MRLFIFILHHDLRRNSIWFILSIFIIQLVAGFSVFFFSRRTVLSSVSNIMHWTIPYDTKWMGDVCSFTTYLSIKLKFYFWCSMSILLNSFLDFDFDLLNRNVSSFLLLLFFFLNKNVYQHRKSDSDYIFAVFWSLPFCLNGSVF